MKKLVLLLFLALGIVPMQAQQDQKTEEAIFAGGCFWCMQPPFDKLEGVVATTVGYTGGHSINPTYQEVSDGATGHYEAIRVTYDPSKVNYAELLKVFWRNVDPFDGGGQFCDRGSSYRSAIFYRNNAEREAAVASEKEVQEKLKGTIATKIIQASAFYPAEEYHQMYYKKNPLRYKYYKFACRREQRLEEIWGKKTGE